jgi:hypothetical protein
LVFAPPVGERASNVHVREASSAAVRRNLLFRDFLSADESALADVGGRRKRPGVGDPQIGLLGPASLGRDRIGVRQGGEVAVLDA